MTSTSHNIVVVGGSLSGLFCALTLMRLGLRVHVLERRTPEELQDQGGGLRLGKDVEDFLASLDSEDELTYLIRHRRLVVFGKDGEEIETKDINVPSTSWGCLHRTLRKTFDQLAPSTHSTFAEAAFVGDVHEDSNGTLVIEYEHHGSTQTMSADLIVGADGAASRVRQLFAPESENNYTGYVVWRGLVSYSSLKGDVSDAMIYNRTWHFGDDYMVVGYSVPGQDDDSLDAREDQVNWAWFLNTPEERLREVMTDVNGKQHSFTVSAGNVSPKVIQEMHESARLELPKDLSTVVRKARLPFVQVITDIFTRQNTFLSGKVVLIGDAVGAMRPHIGTGTGQAVFHARLLGELMKGSISIDQFSRQCIRYSSILYDAGQRLGDICQHLPLTAHEKKQRFATVTAEFYKELDEVQKQVPQLCD